MENKTLIVGLVTLIVGMVIGYAVAPQSFSVSRSMMSNSFGRGLGNVTGGVDRHFIEQMVPHHEGAINMAEKALDRTERPEIRGLANSIIESQKEEVTDMKQWYKDWFGTTYGTLSPDSEYGGGMGMGHMDGRMEVTEGDLEELRTTLNFDREFLDEMIIHHQMAIMMSRMLLSSTDRKEMKTLGTQIITSQQRENDLMEGWRAQWF